LAPHAWFALVQLRPPQQGWALPPHVTHEVPLQPTPGAVQVSPPQHIWPLAPQPPQLLPPQLPPRPGHVDPTATQELPTQHAPPLEVVAAQHAWPGPPPSAHSPRRQAPFAAHMFPAQHACPNPPQGVEGLPEQPTRRSVAATGKSDRIYRQDLTRRRG